MIISNLRLTIRHLSRQKVNTALHVIGLTLGMSVCLLIGLLLRYEWSFDRYHSKADRIYRVTSEYSDAGNTVYHFSTPIPLAESLRAGVTAIENASLAHPLRNDLVEVNSGKPFLQKNMLVVDPEILDIFDIDVIAGNGHAALRKPYHALLTETTAKRFFGNENPLGKTFRFNNEFDIIVGGVVKDHPANTSLPFSILLSFVENKQFLGPDPNDWSMIQGNSTFVILRRGSGLEDFERQLKSIADKHINADPKLPKDIRGDFRVQALKDIHFSKRPGGGPGVPPVNTTWLWFFAMIGVLVLALACINFINLSTAQSLARAKEVGIRKSVGANKNQLIGQFLIESCILALIAGVLSVAVAQISLPSMNTLLNKAIAFNPLDSPGLMASLLFGILFTGVLAGLYPAWLSARFNPSANLKPASVTIQRIAPSMVRRLLVVVQFTISIALLIAVGFIAQQISFMRGKDLGFKKENIIIVPIGNVSKSPLFAAALNQIPKLRKFSFSSGTPMTGEHGGAMVTLTDVNDPDRSLPNVIHGDDQFCDLYGLKLLAGRFPASLGTDPVSPSEPKANRAMKILVNEKLVRDLSIKSNEAAIGKHIWISMGSEDAEIIGVVANFNTNSLHSPMNATIITQLPAAYKQAGISIEPNSDIVATVTSIEEAWRKIYPDEVFDFHFLDQSIDDIYKAEAKLYILFKIFSGLAMCISCVGLWALVTLAAQQRTKEIGIRKVLGASVKRIVLLLSKDFVSMVVIALFLAVPLVWYLVNNWLQNFAYRIEIGWEIFAIAGTASIGIALITVSIQALKAALANPVDSLRSE